MVLLISSFILLIILLIPFSLLPAYATLLKRDLNGYIVYCPCMGRFGNQADHFLGSLSFAKALNRTLILPPWVEYVSGQPRSVQIPFDRYFLVEPLLEYHRVITMDSFMKELAIAIWPKGERTVFCYSGRHGDKEDDCNAKSGNPFGPFWDTFQIDFDKSEFFGRHTLSYDVQDPNLAQRWNRIYPVEKFPVLAFPGAPATFPVRNADRLLHRYLKWSANIEHRATMFIENKLPSGPFVGIHLRNHLDWDNVCKHVESSQQLFASPQCLGYSNEHGKLTQELCKPSKQTIIKQVIKAVKTVKAKSVFVAADKDHMLDELNNALKAYKVKAYRQEVDEPHVSLAILGRADFYIGNCVSSFSAFAKRERDVKDLPSAFWAFDQTTKIKREQKPEEL